jgi:hypothetical protein
MLLLLNVKSNSTFSHLRNLLQAQNFGVTIMASSTKSTSSSNVGQSSLKQDRNSWIFGFTPQAEVWNGRLAMLGFVSAVLIEVFSSQGLLHFWHLI